MYTITYHVVINANVRVITIQYTFRVFYATIKFTAADFCRGNCTKRNAISPDWKRHSDVSAKEKIHRREAYDISRVFLPPIFSVSPLAFFVRTTHTRRCWQDI